MAELKRAPKFESGDVRELYRDVDAPKRTRKKRTALPLNARPIVCPPDGAGRSRTALFLGYFARYLVIAFAVFGFSFFLADTFDFHYVGAVRNNRGQLVDTDMSVTGTIFLAAFIVTAILMLACLFRRVRVGLLAVGGVSVVAVGVISAVSSDFLMKLLSVPVTLVNEMLERLHRVNFFTALRTIDGMDAGLSESFRVKAAGVLLTVAVAAVFVPSMARRVRLLPPALFVGCILTFVFACNITRSNWAFALLLASFTAIVVMRAFDRLYAGEPNKERYDTTVRFVDYTDRPEMPREITEKEQSAARKRAERAAARDKKRDERREKRSRKNAPTVDEELAAYFAAPKPKHERAERPARVRPTPAEKKAARDKERAEAREKRAHDREVRQGVARVRAYDRGVADSRAASGGLAGLAVFLLMLLLLFIPAMTVSGKFETIPEIDERLEAYREYLTALLVGDEELLDAIDYERDPANTAPHSAALSDRYYDGSQIFYVRTHAANNVYLKGWIATDYRDGYWYSASEKQLSAYRKLFGLSEFPAETVASDFYRYMLNSSYLDPSDDEVDWDTEYSYLPSYGAILEKVNIRRISDALGSLAYLPTIYVPETGVLLFEEAGSADLDFINYYDGIMTGRDFKDAEEYAALAYVMTMQDERVMERLGAKIVEYNANRTLCSLYGEGYFTDPRVNLYVFTSVTSDGSTIKTATYEPLSCKVTSYFDEKGNLLDVKVSRTEVGVAEISFSLFEAYATMMTKAEKAELEASYENYDTYRDYVYDTYLDVSVLADADGGYRESEIVSSLADFLAKDFSFPLEDGVAGAEYDAASYLERHEFILSVLEYLKENYTYIARDEETLDITIDFDSLEIDESLDAIENFLAVTKAGYCVQFASALTLILRERGIPARYVEGYVLDGQTRDYNTWEMIFEGTVKDYNAHSWVEVWYDGIGWVQYEATPGEYYYDMYPRPSDVTTPDTTDPTPPTSVPDPPDTPDDEEFPDVDDMTEEERLAAEEAARRARIWRIVRTVLLVISLVGILILLLYLIAHAANKRERERDALVRAARSKSRMREEERRETALRLIDAVTELFSLYGLEPRTGELRSEYAERLCEIMPEVFGKTPEDGELPSPFSYELDAGAIQMAIAAEEFGGGMTQSALSELAEFYDRLRTQKKRFVSPVRRFFLHYFARKL